MVQLFIDSSHIDDITVKLTGDDFVEVIKTPTKSVKGSQVLLPTIQEILEKKGKSLQDITEIMVFEGPGSYTGKRVGASVANTLSFTLSIPINQQKIGTFVYPSYE